eukprot:COSAG02_NODE_6524_length_3520_cov_3.026893_4_plen_36_part_00
MHAPFAHALMPGCEAGSARWEGCVTGGRTGMDLLA